MDIKYLILKSIYSTLSDSERHELNTWLEEGRNASLYERIKNNLKARDAVHFLANVDVERALRRVHCNRRKPLITFISTVASVAAVALIVLFLCPAADNLPVDKEQPGQQVATLTLSTGEVVQLDDWTSTQRLKEVSMDVSGGEIKVRAEEKETQPQSREPVYNTLTVPRGENYSIVLADGTRVWVNALSSLKFPTSFKGADSRTVELVGEGFFEVAHDTLHPFRVMTAQQTIIVTGTAFNVTAYAEEVSRTTLCQGRVTVETFAGDVVRMIPGQQLSVDESGETELREVNTDIYMAWMKGKYYFDSRTIEEVLTELEKWFEINEVEFTDASFKQRLFSGKFKKSDGLEIILRTMERGIEGRIEYKDGRVTIGKK